MLLMDPFFFFCENSTHSALCYHYSLYPDTLCGDVTGYEDRAEGCMWCGCLVC